MEWRKERKRTEKCFLTLVVMMDVRATTYFFRKTEPTTAAQMILVFAASINALTIKK